MSKYIKQQADSLSETRFRKTNKRQPDMCKTDSRKAYEPERKQMRVIFDEEMKQVADDLKSMTGYIEKAIVLAGKALLENDIESAQQLIDNDSIIDGLEVSIIDRCVVMLAKQNPVATDLRVVVSSMRLASTFERMGDLARHIGETARRSYPNSAITNELKDIFVQMQAFTADVAGRLSDILEEHDTAVAKQIIDNDSKLNALHNSVFALVTGDEWTGTRQQVIDTVLLSRFYERFGDHAVFVARKLIYIVSGFDPAMDPGNDDDND